MLFCLYMALVYMPWDIFIKPVAEDQEVWFGYMFTGWACLLYTSPSPRDQRGSRMPSSA